MSRMEVNALTQLHNATEAGGYTLPTELTDALRTYERVKTVTVAEPEPFDTDAAAGRIVAQAAVGGTVDVTQLVEVASEAHQAATAAAQANEALRLAVELAASTATNLASDLTERIISEHLAPVYVQTLEEVREVAAILRGHSRDPHALLTAPTKVRNAYLKLPALVDKHRAIREARRLANVIGHRKPQHDAADLYALFAQPMVLRPGWKPPARVWQVDSPSDPTEFLLWLVSDAVASAKPWLPTVEEQDAAWWAQFGEGQEKRAQAHRNGLAVGARIGA